MRAEGGPVRRILIIDDDELLRTALARAIRAAGHDPLEAGEGRRGLDLAKRFSPDVVITDINMPDQDGIQTILELKELDPAPPVIVISGEPSIGEYAPLEDARLFGADAVLAKPFAMDALMSEIERLLGREAES